MTNEELLAAYNAHERRITVVEERVSGIAESVIKEAQFERTIIPLREKMDTLANILAESQKANQEAQRENQRAQRATQEEIQKLAQAVSEAMTSARANAEMNQDIMRRIGDLNEEQMREAGRQAEENHRAELAKKQAEIDELKARESASQAAEEAARAAAEKRRFDVVITRYGSLFLLLVSIGGTAWAIWVYLVKAAMQHP